MAPEVLNGAPLAVTLPATDVWSYGCEFRRVALPRDFIKSVCSRCVLMFSVYVLVISQESIHVFDVYSLLCAPLVVQASSNNSKELYLLVGELVGVSIPTSPPKPFVHFLVSLEGATRKMCRI